MVARNSPSPMSPQRRSHGDDDVKDEKLKSNVFFRHLFSKVVCLSFLQLGP